METGEGLLELEESDRVSMFTKSTVLKKANEFLSFDTQVGRMGGPR